MNPDSLSHKSDTSSTLSMTYLAKSMQKASEWLNELSECHYVPYNSCNSLTIFSYKYWESQNKFLVATKANNFKEFGFKSLLSASEDTMDNDHAFMNPSSDGSLVLVFSFHKRLFKIE